MNLPREGADMQKENQLQIHESCKLYEGAKVIRSELRENYLDIFVQSWKCREGNCTSIEEILQWVQERNNMLHVQINRIPFAKCDNWKFENGRISHINNGFFEIAGFQQYAEGKLVHEQPILLQFEVGYLGILCKVIDGVLNFLMQAKIEPGNVNKIQISPTIQATKSNFTRKHGGTQPAYLEYFNENRGICIVDQLQSEQASRFFHKRNRNIICLIEDEVEVLSTHKWMTLGQIKELMKIDNLVNMDTRTVLSCIPFAKWIDNRQDFDDGFFREVFAGNIDIQEVFRRINDCKMYSDTENRIVALQDLHEWVFDEYGWHHEKEYHFEVMYAEIEIEGREVRRWSQPLFMAVGKALFGMLTFVDNGERKFIVRQAEEIGTFDTAELGPTIQMESGWENKKEYDSVQKLFFDKWDRKEHVLADVILSEEGGRFFEEQNVNVIIEVEKDEIIELPSNYFVVNYLTLNAMIQFPNQLNIQLRNLLSLIDFK